MALLGAAAGCQWIQKLAMHGIICYSQPHGWRQSDGPPSPRQQVPFARYLRHSCIPHLLLPLTKWQELSREALGVFTMGYLGAVFTAALFTEKSGHLPAAHEKHQCTNGWVSVRDLAHHSELERRVTCLDKRQ